MAKTPVHVTVTGAAGQIGYAILFRIASGQLLGPDQPVVLRLLEIEPAMKALDGVAMELDDCAFPLLAGIETTSDLTTAFSGTSWALLVGSIPRKAGMERGDLLNVNGGIFKPQGQAINSHAADDVRVLVVGQPVQHELPDRAEQRARRAGRPLVRDDAARREPRADASSRRRPGVPVADVTNMTIWGNHSATQYPDFANAKIGGKPAPDVITDQDWLRTTFIETVQKRGAAIIEARGLSSAASAANAAIDSVNSIHTAPPAGDWASLAVVSRGEYGTPEGLQYGFPVASDGKGGWSVVEGLDPRRLRPGEAPGHHRGARGRARRGPALGLI